MKPVHGIPAILSFFFPGLGQLCKEQWMRAATIWALMLAPWIVWFLFAAIIVPEVMGTMTYGDMASKIAMIVKVFLSSPILLFVLLLNLVVHLWAVVDAYNTPTT